MSIQSIFEDLFIIIRGLLAFIILLTVSTAAYGINDLVGSILGWVAALKNRQNGGLTKQQIWRDLAVLAFGLALILQCTYSIYQLQMQKALSHGFSDQSLWTLIIVSWIVALILTFTVQQSYSDKYIKRDDLSQLSTFKNGARFTLYSITSGIFLCTLFVMSFAKYDDVLVLSNLQSIYDGDDQSQITQMPRILLLALIAYCPCIFQYVMFSLQESYSIMSFISIPLTRYALVIIVWLIELFGYSYMIDQLVVYAYLGPLGLPLLISMVIFQIMALLFENFYGTVLKMSLPQHVPLSVKA
ncbi:hypothetical protein MIR68_012515 [Amoeboaphelidium protococcarum]|nr:hypothetical protein MIR68_012515 [Amoeboaphelidium protococcarum]KAI3644101.1 hypothetical protein MP228_010265 [Amoeboaphelidium protococcarum]